MSLCCSRSRFLALCLGRNITAHDPVEPNNVGLTTNQPVQHHHSSRTHTHTREIERVKGMLLYSKRTHIDTQKGEKEEEEVGQIDICYISCCCCTRDDGRTFVHVSSLASLEYNKETE